MSRPPSLLVLAALVTASACSSYGDGDDAKKGTGGPITPAGDAGTGISFSPSNIPREKLGSEGAGALLLSGAACEVDGTAGTIACDGTPVTGARFFTHDQAGGGKLSVFVTSSIRVEQTTAVTFTGTTGIVLVALEDVDVIGTISVAAKDETPGAGGFATSDEDGLGPGGGPHGGDSGPGGAGFCGVGGKGGAFAGTAPLEGGKSYGTSELVPLIGGSAGGASTNVGGGGAGGGAIQIIAGGAINVSATGVINAGGGAANAESGAGSGGAILLEAPTVLVAGTLAANGGSGGGGLTDFGNDASPNDKPAAGGGEGTDSRGGDGSAAANINGGDAVLAADANRRAGGGGAAGRIRINSPNGTKAGGAVISPGSTCFTQGTLAP